MTLLEKIGRKKFRQILKESSNAKKLVDIINDKAIQVDKNSLISYDLSKSDKKKMFLNLFNYSNSGTSHAGPLGVVVSEFGKNIDEVEKTLADYNEEIYMFHIGYTIEYLDGKEDLQTIRKEIIPFTSLIYSTKEECIKKAKEIRSKY